LPHFSASDSGWRQGSLAPRLAGERIIAMFASIARYFESLRRYDNAVRELSHLSDRELADIGVSRSDIGRIASEHAHS
jgi:uncharacterized protein YjiS (DUF1127 family)